MGTLCSCAFRRRLLLAYRQAEPKLDLDDQPNLLANQQLTQTHTKIGGSLCASAMSKPIAPPLVSGLEVEKHHLDFAPHFERLRSHVEAACWPEV